MEGTRRVLAADDDPVVLAFVHEVLTSGGYEVETSGDGEEARRTYAQGVHSLLVLDFKMPGRTGTDVLFELRDRGDRVPAIIMSSDSREVVFASRAEPGNVVFLRKPFGVPEFRSALAGLIHAVPDVPRSP